MWGDEMATIYTSYQHDDEYIVNTLIPLLTAKGHEIRSDKNLYIGSSWREGLMALILASEFLLVLWSENTKKSQFVPAEIGAARVSGTVQLLPVVIGNAEMPNFIGDLTIERVPDCTPEALSLLADQLDESIQKYFEFQRKKREDKPKIFISHRHKDEALVRALVDCIDMYFNVRKQDIRCTSVRPYRLPVGENSAERLRSEITDAEVVLGILTTDTLQSSYVAFELGSAWGQRVWTCPLLAGGATQAHIPDPIRGLSPLFLHREGDCHQLLSDLEGVASLVKRQSVDPGALLDRISRLVEAAAASGVAPTA
jgi:hypothetical protein